MQLISLWVEDFKNLKNFTINFESQENLSIIIGNNGSGKSNVLEALSSIFSELYIRSGRRNKSNYILKYQIDDKTIELTQDEIIVNGIKQSKKYLSNNNLLPSRIVALYSGEETRLYKNYYESFTKKYLRDFSQMLSPSNNMIYIDKSYWSIALLTLILSAESGNDDHKRFLENNLGIKNVKNIHIDFKTSYFSKIKKDSPLDILLGIINFDKKNSIDYPNNSLFLGLNPEYNSMTIEEIFNILLHATLLQRAKIFEKIIFTINDEQIGLNDLSEGEKKKLLLKATMDLVANEKSLILLDEPDAHIHVESKQEIYSIFNEYASTYNRSFVITTHSPTLTNYADDKNIIMLTKNCDGNCDIIDDSKKTLIQQLTGNIYNINEQNIIFNSSKPLVLVEGKSDIKYIKRALELYKEFPSNYNFISFNGTGNAHYFYNETQEYLQNRKVIILLDRDEAGVKALGTFTNQNMKDRKWQDYMNDDNIYKKNNLYILLLPKTDKYKENTKVPFLIEDYFSEDCRLKILNEKITEEGGTLKSFGSLEKKVKSCLENRLGTKNEECMEEFKILLDKIKEIIDGNNIQNLVEIN